MRQQSNRSFTPSTISVEQWWYSKHMLTRDQTSVQSLLSMFCSSCWSRCPLCKSRFTPEAKAARHPFVYLPFGAGPRNCVGMRVAQLEMKMGLARLFRTFSLVTCAETEVGWDYEKGIACFPPLYLTNTSCIQDGLLYDIWYFCLSPGSSSGEVVQHSWTQKWHICENSEERREPRSIRHHSRTIEVEEPGHLNHSHIDMQQCLGEQL